jgi:hypothetical protein
MNPRPSGEPVALALSPHKPTAYGSPPVGGSNGNAPWDRIPRPGRADSFVTGTCPSKRKNAVLGQTTPRFEVKLNRLETQAGAPPLHREVGRLRQACPHRRPWEHPFSKLLRDWRRLRSTRRISHLTVLDEILHVDAVKRLEFEKRIGDQFDRMLVLVSISDA